MEILFILLIGLMCIGCLALALYAIIMFTKNSISNSVNGVKVNAIIKKVENKKDIDKRQGATYDQHIELECEFEYQGQMYNKILSVYNEINDEKFKVGDNIEVVYNPKTKKLADELNLNWKDNKKFYIAVIAGVAMALYGIFCYREGIVITEVILIILCVIFWYASIFLFYDFYYIKDKNKYIKLKGHVIDYHIRYEVDELGHWNYFYPEVSFKYNHEKKKYISSRGGFKKNYNIGQEVDVYYNPETDKIYEKNNNKRLYLFMVIPPICALIALIQYLLK